MEKTNKIAAIAFLALGSIGTLAMIGASQAANAQVLNQVSANPSSANVANNQLQLVVGKEINDDSSVKQTDVKDQNEIGENGKETNDEANDFGNKNEKDEVLPTNAISKEIAMKNALNGKSNVTITETKIGDEDGVIVYEFEISDNTDVKIDAIKGTVVQDENDQKEGNDSDKEVNDDSSNK